MTISTDFSIDASGNIRQVTAFVPGTHTRYSTLDLHAHVQDLADNATESGDDLISILDANPSELAGKRNVSRPMALSLLNGVNMDDATSQWFKFGSVEQGTGNRLYTGLKVLGTLVTSSPIYIMQSGSKITKYWQDADASNFQILVKAKTGDTLIDSGNITVYSRKYGQSYSHFDVNLSAGGEQAAALSTALDGNIDIGVMTPAIAAGYFATAIGGTGGASPKITLAYGDTTQDLGGGQGSLLHKGTITLDGSLTLSQAYQALMWACSESSTITFNTIPGFRYRVLPGQTYAENVPAPFGSFAGGKWFVAQGWWLTGVQSADSKNYQLISHTGVTEVPPTSIVIEVGGVVSGDYVLAARDNGSGGFDFAEYTVSASAGATTLSVTGLKVDTPASGVVRIDGDRYTYTSWTGTTLSGLSPAIKSGGYSSRPCFIPFIDAAASSTSIQSAAMQFNTGFSSRFRVRKGDQIVPFESVMAVTSNGGSGTAVRNSDV